MKLVKSNLFIYTSVLLMQYVYSVPTNIWFTTPYSLVVTKVSTPQL
jgi:hypothetical protein